VGPQEFELPFGTVQTPEGLIQVGPGARSQRGGVTGESRPRPREGDRQGWGGVLSGTVVIVWNIISDAMKSYISVWKSGDARGPSSGVGAPGLWLIPQSG